MADKMHPQLVADFLWNLAPLASSLHRQDDLLDAETGRGKDFLLDAADAQHPASEADLAGDGNFGPDPAACGQ